MLESEDSGVSNTPVRKDVWVRVPPAAPDFDLPWPECRALPPDPIACVDERGLGPAYVYLLGIYLGDGCISRHPRGVYKLRVFQDVRYRSIIDRIVSTIAEVAGKRAATQKRPGSVETSSYWKHWPCLFPQHGSGEKHLRGIQLEDWQWSLVERHPAEVIAGLIHSDGCRSTNRVRGPGKDVRVPALPLLEPFGGHSRSVHARVWPGRGGVPPEPALLHIRGEAT